MHGPHWPVDSAASQPSSRAVSATAHRSAGRATTRPTPRSAPWAAIDDRLTVRTSAAPAVSQLPAYPPTRNEPTAPVVPPTRASSPAIGSPSGTSTTPGWRTAPRTVARTVPGSSGVPVAEPVGAVPRDQREVRERLGVGEQGGAAADAALGGAVGRHGRQRRAAGQVLDDRRGLAGDVAVRAGDDPRPAAGALGDGGLEAVPGVPVAAVRPDDHLAGAEAAGGGLLRRRARDAGCG